MASGRAGAAAAPLPMLSLNVVTTERLPGSLEEKGAAWAAYSPHEQATFKASAGKFAALHVMSVLEGESQEPPIEYAHIENFIRNLRDGSYPVLLIGVSTHYLRETPRWQWAAVARAGGDGAAAPAPTSIDFGVRTVVSAYVSSPELAIDPAWVAPCAAPPDLARLRFVGRQVFFSQVQFVR